MPAKILDWDGVDKSEWGQRPDSEIAKQLGVSKDVIIYWREKFGIPSNQERIAKEKDEKYQIGLHWCSKCQRYLPIDSFGKSANRRFGLKTWCKECRKKDLEENPIRERTRRREHYLRNKDKILAANRKWRRENRDKVREYTKERHAAYKRQFVELAGGQCHRCGYSEFDSGLDFHHVNKNDKDNSPVSVIASGDFDRAYEELDKCALLCRNCHQAYHSNDWNGEFVKREELGWTIKQT